MKGFSRPSRKSRFRPRRPGEERPSDPSPLPEDGDPAQELYEPEQPNGGEAYEPEQASNEDYGEQAGALPEENLPAAEIDPAGDDTFAAAASPGPAVRRHRPAAGGTFAPESEPMNGAPAPPLDEEDRPSVVARPRRPPLQERYVYTSPYAIPWLRPFLWGLLVLGGGVGGYFLGGAGKTTSEASKPAPLVRTIRMVEKPPPLKPDERQQLDLAFQAGREGRYNQSGQLFATFSQKHRLWTKVPLEVARMYIYQGDYISAQKILVDLMQGDSDARPDAFFLTGVLNLKAQNFPDAEIAFASATDADPTNSQYFYFWGDCLRQEGKPQEARTRFLSALYRNQYETAEDLLQLKVWLCDIMMDQEQADGANAAINAALATPYPRAAALLAAAARSLKVDRFNEAASFIARGRAAMDQVVFNVILHDPTFFQESWRPELAPFYKAEGAPAPAASPAPAGVK